MDALNSEGCASRRAGGDMQAQNSHEDENDSAYSWEVVRRAREKKALLCIVRARRNQPESGASDTGARVVMDDEGALEVRRPQARPYVGAKTFRGLPCSIDTIRNREPRVDFQRRVEMMTAGVLACRSLVDVDAARVFGALRIVRGVATRIQACQVIHENLFFVIARNVDYTSNCEVALVPRISAEIFDRERG